MKTQVEGEILIINSRYNRFWFELILVVNEQCVKTFGQYRTPEEAEEVRQQVINNTY
jgi:hypothetical protein